MVVYFSVLVWFCCFFFQAEDGIRDLVRSRGLGDVYKRQRAMSTVVLTQGVGLPGELQTGLLAERMGAPFTVGAVSYTHLTLPTSDLV